MQRLSQPQAHQLKDVKATPKPGSNKQERGFVKSAEKRRASGSKSRGSRGGKGGRNESKDVECQFVRSQGASPWNPRRNGSLISNDA